jgi:predicted phosphoadenosine phosphosulfate sulfurtransferase
MKDLYLYPFTKEQLQKNYNTWLKMRTKEKQEYLAIREGKKLQRFKPNFVNYTHKVAESRKLRHQKLTIKYGIINET